MLIGSECLSHWYDSVVQESTQGDQIIGSELGFTGLSLKTEYGCMEVAEAKRLRELEIENKKLKKLLAETMLEKVALKDPLGRKW